MKIGIASIITDQTIGLVDYFQTCESLGFDLATIGEHPAVPVDFGSNTPSGRPIADRYHRFPDLFVGLGVAAQVTRTIKIGSCICLVPQHHPVALAKAVASVDYFSNGRFVFGVGGGWLREETEIMGGDFDNRWEQTVEYIQAGRELWTKDEAAFSGQFVKFPAIYSYPKPVQRPYPPVHIGAGTGDGPCGRALRNTVAVGDGWMPVAMSPERLRENLATLQQMCEKAGRDFEGIEISVVLLESDQSDPKGLLGRYEEVGCHRIIFGDQVLPPDGEGRAKLEAIAKRYIG